MNSEVVRRWLMGDLNKVTKRKAYGSGIFYFTGDTIFSYGSHFPISTKQSLHGGGDSVFVVNKDRYSITTSRHQLLVESAIWSRSKVFAKTSDKCLKGHVLFFDVFEGDGVYGFVGGLSNTFITSIFGCPEEISVPNKIRTVKDAVAYVKKKVGLSDGRVYGHFYQIKPFGSTAEVKKMLGCTKGELIRMSPRTRTGNVVAKTFKYKNKIIVGNNILIVGAGKIKPVTDWHELIIADLKKVRL